MKRSTAALVGAAIGGGYFAAIESGRTPANEDCVYDMPTSTDWLAFVAGGLLLYTGNDNVATGVGAAIVTIHAAKVARRARKRRARRLSTRSITHGAKSN